MRNSLVTGFLVIILSTLMPVPEAAAVPPEQARQDYAAAREAIELGQWQQYRTIRARLDDYPLAIYLDYFALRGQIHRVDSDQAKDFLEQSADSPLPNRFLGAYLRQIGKSGRWEDFLAVMPTEPNSVELKCYYFRAQLSEGNKAQAWSGAAKLWVYGKSQVKQCDPLFKEWLAAGQLTDAIVWKRLLNAFDARQGALMQYVARKGSAELRPFSDRLLAIYKNPKTLRNTPLPAGGTYATDMASHSLVYLARYNPEQALRDWIKYQGELSFDEEQVRRVESAIALRSLFAETESNLAWLPGALDRLDDDKLVEIRLRWALSESDWPALEDTLPLLSDSASRDGTWRYWQARVLQQSGDTSGAQMLFKELAAERSFHGFLAADYLDQPYQFNHQVLTAVETDSLLEKPGIARLGELRYHDEMALAHSEWFKILRDTSDPAEQLELAQLALGEGWYRMAIDAANQAKASDSLDLRFPTHYQAVFNLHGKKQNVPGTELMSIARRESAFFPGAQSPVGARGMMQVMPATGKQVAASIGEPHKAADLFDLDHNVLLGSTYYRQMLDRFDGNRIFALTAYNAGPHRVALWRNNPPDGVPMDVWVDTIPFKETRNYVQAVLAYNVVFQYLTGNTQALLNPAERQFSY